uniref:Acetyl-coenzyme A carboxylase carboxyl transferase subunit beta n=1 Tax=Medicago suffruticosa TaxID=66818 RepID=A0A4P8F1L3_9FABA|nr:acetyl-CoA carboxylase beta subunit [Medicago suffruticosa]QCO73256.1 acetyl-CoA carboxylase beta subunit [Medicago suffruticosa]
MEKWWFNSMMFNRGLEYRCGLSKSIDSFGPIENNSVNEDPSILTDMDNTIHNWKNNSENSSYSHGDYLVDVRNIRNFISDKTFLVRDSNRNSYSIYFAIENQILEIDNNHSFLNEPESFFYSYQNSSYLKNDSKGNDHNDRYDTKYNWNNNINSCIESYLRSKICIDSEILDDSDINSYILDDSNDSEILDDSNDSDILDDSDKYNDSDINSYINSYILDDSNDSYILDDSNDSYILDDSNDSYILDDSNDSEILDDSNDSEILDDSNDSEILDDSNDSDKYNDFNISDKVQNSTEIESTSIITITNDTNDSYPKDFSHLWVSCDSCYGVNYKKYFKSKMNICEYCGCHLKMSSSDRIELLIDPGTWNPMDEDMFSVDPIEWNRDSEDEPFEVDPLDWNWDWDSEDEPFEVDPLEWNSEDELSEDDSSEIDSFENLLDSSENLLDSSENDSSENRSEDKPSEDDSSENRSEDEPSEDEDEDDDYLNRLDSYQNRTGLLEAVQTGTGQLNGIPVAIGIMDFQFMGGSMGSVVGEKITRLIEYATNQLLPLIIVCASGGARMQEGSLSLMQMAKISSALYNYQINQKLFYVSILTSPTTGGVTASFGMLGDIVIVEPDAYIAFAGKRVIEQTLNTEVPEGSQSAEYLFEKGLFDSIVPRNSLKEVLSELFHFNGFFPLTQTEK